MISSVFSDQFCNSPLYFALFPSEIRGETSSDPTASAASRLSTLLRALDRAVFLGARDRETMTRTMIWELADSMNLHDRTKAIVRIGLGVIGIARG